MTQCMSNMMYYMPLCANSTFSTTAIHADVIKEDAYDANKILMIVLILSIMMWCSLIALLIYCLCKPVAVAFNTKLKKTMDNYREHLKEQKAGSVTCQ